MIGLAAASLVCFAMVFVGAKLRCGRAYGWIAGYNTASPEEKAKYDVEGLAHHLGNGLMTMGVLLLLAGISAALSFLTWCFAFIGLFVFVAFLIVVGGRKFLPNAPKPGDHRLLRALLPDRAFRAVREGTRNWLIECPCGAKADFWEKGGVRYKAVGEPRQWTGCESCGKLTWQKVRRKTEAEKKEVA